MLALLSDSKGKIKNIQQNGKVVENEQQNEGDEDVDDETASLSNIKYEDPGAYVKDPDDETPEEMEQRRQIHGLASALLQISQAIDPKYFKPPYGNFKSGGKNGTKEENAEKAQRNLERWQVSLMNSSNSSQLFLHYNVLYDAIKWTRSAQNARCSCRSSKDPDKLLLCDGCNVGRHIYCLKPKLTVSLFAINFNSSAFADWKLWTLQKVPEGDWYCAKCKPNQQPQKKKRQFIYAEEEEEDDEEEEEDEENDNEDESESDESTLESLFEEPTYVFHHHQIESNFFINASRLCLQVWQQLHGQKSVRSL